MSSRLKETCLRCTDVMHAQLLGEPDIDPSTVEWDLLITSDIFHFLPLDYQQLIEDAERIRQGLIYMTREIKRLQANGDEVGAENKQEQEKEIKQMYYEGTLNLFGGLGDDFCKKMIQLESYPGKLLCIQHEMPDLVDMVSKRLKKLP